MSERSRELKAAVIAGDHAAAERAAAGYVKALEEYWATFPEHERLNSPLPARARELLAWAREMTIIQRSLAADQLSVLQKANRYRPAAGTYAGLAVEG